MQSSIRPSHEPAVVSLDALDDDKHPLEVVAARVEKATTQKRMK
jgi:hypothetical protein